MLKPYTIRHEITSYMSDKDKRFKTVSFMEIAQEAAMKAAEPLGFGYDSLDVHHTVWVISRMHIKFLDNPCWRDQVDLQTWHKGISGLLFLRDFKLTDTDGTPRIIATSSWLVMDILERRLVRPDRMEGIVPADGQGFGDAVAQPAPKLVMPKSACPQVLGTHTVAYSDTDFNGHANNTKYVEWVLNALPQEIVDRPLKELVINYNQELMPSEEITLYMLEQPSEDGSGVSYLVEGKQAERQIFIAKFIY